MMSEPLYICHREQHLMGTSVSIQLAVPSPYVSQAVQDLQESFLWLAEVEEHLTRFQPDSELMRLNAHVGSPFEVTPILLECLSVALQAAERTNGLYDPALLPHLEAAGYHRDFQEIAHREVGRRVSTLPETGRWREIQLDRAHSHVTLPPGVQLDLGGIAKGWAADKLAASLLAPYNNALINIGGDLRVRGENAPGSLWAIAIDHPFSPAMGEGQVAVVTPGRGGVATSGANRRWWWQDRQVSHHLIDPRTGYPMRVWTPPEAEQDAQAAATLIATVTTFAETAVEAEIAAKLALLYGFPDALQSAIKIGTTPLEREAALLLVLGNGQLHPSPNLDAWLHHHAGQKGIWYKD